MQIQGDDLKMVWFSLVMEQQKHTPGTKMWFRYEDFIRKVEKELGMKERPRLKEVHDTH